MVLDDVIQQIAQLQKYIATVPKHSWRYHAAKERIIYLEKTYKKHYVLPTQLLRHKSR